MTTKNTIHHLLSPTLFRTVFLLGILSIAVAIGAGVVTADDHEADFALADYATEEGVIETEGLREAISDWRAGEIETNELREVITAWRSGESVIDDGTDDGADDGTDDGTDDGADDGTDDGTDDGADDGTDDGTDDGDAADLSIRIVSTEATLNGTTQFDLDVEVRNAGGETNTRLGIMGVRDADTGAQLLSQADPVDRKIATNGGFKTTVAGSIALDGSNQIIVTVGVGDDLTDPDDTDQLTVNLAGGAAGIDDLNGTQYGSLNAALDAAEPGDEIELNNQTFVEDAEITTDDITIFGQGVGETVIDGNVSVMSDDVTIRDLTIQGDYEDNGTNNELQTVDVTSASPGGLITLNGADAELTAVSTESLVINGEGMTLVDSTIGTAETETAVTIKSGVSNASLTFDGTEIVANPDGGVGILLETGAFAADDADRRSELIDRLVAIDIDADADGEDAGTANQQFRVVFDGDSVQTAVDASGVADSVILTDGTYAESVSVTVPVLTVEGYEESAPDVGALVIEAEDVTLRSIMITGDGITTDTLVSIEANGTTLEASRLGPTDSVTGISVNSTVDATSVQITQNDILADTGIENDGTGSLDATANWWDDTNGPGGAGTGDGSTIDDAVSFDPWLNGPIPGGQPVTIGGFDVADVAIDRGDALAIDFSNAQLNDSTTFSGRLAVTVNTSVIEGISTDETVTVDFDGDGAADGVSILDADTDAAPGIYTLTAEADDFDATAEFTLSINGQTLSGDMTTTDITEGQNTQTQTLGNNPLTIEFNREDIDSATVVFDLSNLPATINESQRLILDDASVGTTDVTGANVQATSLDSAADEATITLDNIADSTVTINSIELSDLNTTSIVVEGATYNYEVTLREVMVGGTDVTDVESVSTAEFTMIEPTQVLRGEPDAFDPSDLQSGQADTTQTFGENNDLVIDLNRDDVETALINFNMSTVVANGVDLSDANVENVVVSTGETGITIITDDNERARIFIDDIATDEVTLSSFDVTRINSNSANGTANLSYEIDIVQLRITDPDPSGNSLPADPRYDPIDTAPFDIS